MAGKRGQFTVFVILGFVLVSTFAFLLFARNLVQSDELKARANSVVEDALANSNINYYVKTCLDRVTDDAVYLASLQGGRIYENQGGSYPNPDPEMRGFDYLPFNVSEPFNNSHYGILNISYGILPNVNSNCLSTNPPLYPLVSTFLPDIKEKFHLNSILGNPEYCSFDTGAFGVFSLPRLCDEEGPNKINVTGKIEFQFKTCKGLSYGENSIQEQLATYISNRITECVDFKIFENIGYNITAINKPESIVIFGKEELTVQTKYPFKVRIGRKSVTTYASFEVDKPILLKELYEYIYGLIEKEYKDLYFEIDRDYSTSGGWDQKISVLKRTNPCLACIDGSFDDIYQVVDNRSNIRGKPLVFNFAIKNRIPALDYIHGGYNYNVVVMEGDEIVFEPFALDADENALLYTYGGWREDYVDVFDEDCCLEDLNDCFDNPNKCVDKSPTGFIPNAWTGSKLYLNTDQFASYKTTHQDIGFHITYINVTDEEGLVDYQNISIMVFDEPNVEATGYHPYDQDKIPPEHASIEDIYTLDAQSLSFFTMVEEFWWQDNHPIDYFSISTVKKQIVIPDDLEQTSEITNIVGSVFTRQGLGQHIIELKAKFTTPAEETEWTTPATWTVQVEKCLPHRTTDKTALYPYNALELDPFIGYTYKIVEDYFLANHVCCTDGFEYAGFGQNCFNYVDYGDFVKMNERQEIFMKGELLPLNYNFEDSGGRELFNETANRKENSGQLDNEDRNNVIKREFSRECSSDRGNICDGEIDEKYTIADNCGGYTTHQVELCRGPGFVDDEGEPLPTNTPGMFTEDATDMGCVKYGIDKELFSKYYQENKQPPPTYHIDANNYHLIANSLTKAKELVKYDIKNDILPGLDKEQESFENIYGLEKREMVGVETKPADGTCFGGIQNYDIPRSEENHPLDTAILLEIEEVNNREWYYKCTGSYCNPFKGDCSIPNLNDCTCFGKCAPFTYNDFSNENNNACKDFGGESDIDGWCSSNCRPYGPNEEKPACGCVAKAPGDPWTKVNEVATDHYMMIEKGYNQYDEYGELWHCCYEDDDYTERGPEAGPTIAEGELPKRFMEGLLSCCGGELKHDGDLCEKVPFDIPGDDNDEGCDPIDASTCVRKNSWLINGEYVLDENNYDNEVIVILEKDFSGYFSTGYKATRVGCPFPSQEYICEKNMPFNGYPDGICARDTSVSPSVNKCASGPICKRETTFYSNIQTCVKYNRCDWNLQDGFGGNGYGWVNVSTSGTRSCILNYP